jgi:hypothetical protein
VFQTVISNRLRSLYRFHNRGGMSLYQSIGNQVAERRENRIHHRGTLQKFDAYREMFALHASRALCVNAMVGTEARPGPDHGSAGDAAGVQEIEDLAEQKALGGIGVLVQVDDHLLGCARREHHPPNVG